MRDKSTEDDDKLATVAVSMMASGSAKAGTVRAKRRLVQWWLWIVGNAPPGPNSRTLTWPTWLGYTTASRCHRMALTLQFASSSIVWVRRQYPERYQTQRCWPARSRRLSSL